ncbi:MAG TPA: GNAT family N-acetyltransferase [Thermoanaerobaculia bacterium]|nr:GNAT family N-acetyltransferase [Thermoanaerobaculia bacterium]
MAHPSVLIQPLREIPEAGQLFARAFKEDWPDFFADRPVESIEEEIFAPALQGRGLPIVLVASVQGRIAGTVALRARSVETHEHLSPWITGLYVMPGFRGLGIGWSLMLAITAEAAAQGFPNLYAVTNTARGLFSKLGWTAVEDILYHGEEVTLFRAGRGGSSA